MRDFRDAKAMAQTLRDTLSGKSVPISHSESLELVSKLLGVNDWNTLSALLQVDRQETQTVTTKSPQGTTSYPAIPVRDLVPFPGTYFPLFVARERTKLALDRAFERHREVVVVAQRDGSIDEPGFGDIYEVGALATLVELLRLPDGAMVLNKPYNGSIKVLLQANRRVTIRKFIGEAGAFQAEITDISEGPIPDAPELIRKARELFENYAGRHDMNMQQIWPIIGQNDPGRVADVISPHLIMPLSDKQNLLATLDPIVRLEKVAAFLDSHP